MPNRFQILWFPTMRCNLACPVCHFKANPDGSVFMAYGHRHELGRELQWFEWLVYFNRLRPYSLEITGGEPTRHEGFKDLIRHLPPGADWAITSNSLLVDPLLDDDPLPLERCVSWTASYHGKELARFKAGLLDLARAGIRPSVSLVASPGNLEEIEALTKQFGEFTRVNLLRELNPGIDWEGAHRRAWFELQGIARRAGANLVTGEIPPKYEFPVHDRCNAGHDYICAMPDGTVYRCYSDAMLRPEKSLGHIKDFSPLEPMQPCGNPCAGCAVDYREAKA